MAPNLSSRVAPNGGWIRESPLATATHEPTGSLETALSHAGRLLASAPVLAEAQAREILKVLPDNPQALHLLGEALGAEGRGGEAIDALSRAVRLAPRLSDAWRALGDELRRAGDTSGADAADARCLAAAAGDPKLLEAGAALCDGRLAVAERLLRAFLKDQPTDVAAIRMLAEVGGRLGRYADAETLLTRCLELAPRFDAARFNYATVLYRQAKAAETLEQLASLIARDPRNPSYRSLKAAALAQVGEYRRAIDEYRDLLVAYPGQPKAWMSYGHALKTVGRQADAIAAYRKSLDLLPSLGEAYWSLANLKTVGFSAADVAAMAAQLARDDIADEDRFHLDFALGKALEDEGQDAGAFGHYRKANALRRASLDYDAEETTEHARRSGAMFTPTFFAERANFGAPDPDPIFIVGLPRSGSTLIEQILASHSAVEGAMELPDLGSIARRLDGRRKLADPSRYPEILADLDSDAARTLGEEYLARTRIHRKTGRPFFIDKMPNNFAHLGLIHLILPKARIVDARRDPMACGFSCFKQHFARGQGFTYDLTDLGRYYRDYVTLMEHFDRVLPGRVHRVIYEDMVSDTEGAIRALLNHCELPFEDACLRFHENERAVRTASSEQVRRPIFTEGLDQWRRFDAWLGPLKNALGPLAS